MSTSREQYESEMQVLHNTLVSLAHEEAIEINNQVDDILKYRSKKLSAQELADGLINGRIIPVNDTEKNAFGSETEFEGHKYLNFGNIWIMLDETFPVQTENDFHLAGEILSGKVDLPKGTRLPTHDECKHQLFTREIRGTFGDKYADIFGDTEYFYLASTPKELYGEKAYGGWHPEHGGIILSVDNSPILTNGGTSIDAYGKVPRVMKVLLVRDNPLQ